MNSLEKKMVATLVDLKENYDVIGIKAEFEAEGTRLEEAMRLKEVVTCAGFDLTIKIGGCEAIKDMLDAKTIGVNAIVAPMIESAYAMKKYAHAVDFVFPGGDRDDVKFYINLETITSFNNLEDIVSSEDFKKLDGVVLGRVDMTGSMGLSREEINSKPILEIAKKVSSEIKKTGKDLIVGGGVSAYSLPFFKELPYITKFETRKVVFDAKRALKNKDAGKGILKAVGFELMWLKNKREFYKMIFDEDAQRLALLESRYKKLIEEIGGAY